MQACGPAASGRFAHAGRADGLPRRVSACRARGQIVRASFRMQGTQTDCPGEFPHTGRAEWPALVSVDTARSLIASAGFACGALGLAAVAAVGPR